MAKAKETEVPAEIPPEVIAAANEAVNAMADDEFASYLKDERHGDMETDLWARRNFIAGFRRGWAKAKAGGK